MMLPATPLNPHSIPLFCVATILIGLGIFSYTRNPRASVNRWFALMCWSISTWYLGFGIANNFNSPPNFFFWFKVAHIGVMFTAPIYFSLVLQLLRLKERYQLACWGYTAVAIILYGVMWTTPFYFSGHVYHYSWGLYPKATPLLTIHAILTELVVVSCYVLLLIAFRRARRENLPNEDFNRLKWMCVALLAFGFAPIDYLPKYGIPLYPFGYIFTLTFALIVTYAIVRHHLMDIHVAIRRSVLSALILAALIASYFGLIFLAERLFHMTLLQHHILALSLTALTTFGLGLLVFLASPKKRLNQIFGLYSLTIAWWGFSEAGMVGSHDLATANLFSRIEWPSIIFVAAAFLHTVYLLTEDRRKVSRVVLWVSYTVSLVLLVLYFAGFVAKPLRPVGYSPYFNSVTPIGSLVPFLFVVIVNTGLGQLWHVYRSTTGQHRVQLKYLFWGSLAGYLGAMPDWLFVFGFYIRGLSPFGIYAVPLYSIATTYAVLHHKLFDVNLVIRKSLIYSILVGLLTIGYFALIYLLERLYQQTFGYQSVGFSLAAFALMALIFQPLKIGIQRVVDWLFFHVPHEDLVKRMERLEQEIRDADKLKAVATLAAGMAHEIKNPLTSLKTFAEYLPEKGNDPNFQRQFQRIVTQEVKKIDLIVRRVLDFSKPAPPKLEPVQVSRLLDETLDLLSNECLMRRVEVKRRYHSEAAIQADPQQLRQVFLNLILNSLEAIDGAGGRLKVGTMQVDDQLVVTIEDTGKGIAKEHLDHIFDPFFTTKQNGTGLGLSIARSIITDHHGTLTFYSQVNHGTQCALTFRLSTDFLLSQRDTSAVSIR